MTIYPRWHRRTLYWQEPRGQHSLDFRRLYEVTHHPDWIEETNQQIENNQCRKLSVTENITLKCWGRALRPKSDIFIFPLESRRMFSNCNTLNFHGRITITSKKVNRKTCKVAILMSQVFKITLRSRWKTPLLWQ